MGLVTVLRSISHNQSINLLLFLQKQNLATTIYLFGLGTLLTGLGLKHMRICSHHDLAGALVTSLLLGIKPMGSEFSGSSSGDSKDDSSTQARRGSKLDANWMYSGSSSRQTGADNGRVGA